MFNKQKYLTSGVLNTIPIDVIIALFILIDKLKATKVVMGSNSTFGKESKGDIELMKKLAQKYKFEVVEVELLRENGKIVSSTDLRNEVKRSLVWNFLEPFIGD